MVDVFNRFKGARSTFGMKKPVRAATTTNITLSGFQTIDDIVYASTDVNLNMRCLVKDQTDGTENGIYTVNSGDWTREVDFDGNTDFTRGTMTFVSQGTVNGSKLFYVSSADPQDIGVDAINFTEINLDTYVVGGTSIPAAATLDLDGAAVQIVDVTAGAATITAITLSETIRIVRFATTVTLQNGASLVLPGGQDIVAVSGDYAIFVGYTGGIVRCVAYVRANGHPLITQYTAAAAALASAATTQLGSDISQCITITGDVTITSFGSTAPTGAVKFLYFSGNPLLTHNGASLILPGAQNIQIAAGDVMIVRHEGSGNWRSISFSRASSAVPGGMLSVNTTTASTTGSTLESTLMSYSMPGMALARNGYGVRIRAWGTAAATTALKQMKLYFGATAIADTGSLAVNGLSWRFDADVVRTSTAAQTAITSVSMSSTGTFAASCQYSTPGEVLGSTASPVTIKLTGQALTTVSTAISAQCMTVQLLTI